MSRLPVSLIICLGILLTACGGGGGGGTTTTTTTTTPTTPTTPTPVTSGTLTLSSPAAIEGGTLPQAFTCDGGKLSVPLTWKGAPSTTKSFTVLMTTLPGDGTTKWNWVLYNIPAATTRLTVNTSGVGVLGAADDGAGNAYAPPCSQGPGAKVYSFTLYALSDNLTFTQSASQITGKVVTDALKSVTLSSSTLNVSYTRNTTAPVGVAATNCAQLQASIAPWAEIGRAHV